MEAVCAQAVLLGDSWVLVLGCLHDAYHEIVEEHKVSILLVSLPVLVQLGMLALAAGLYCAWGVGVGWWLQG